ncbi:MAG: DNA recombination protein RmuC [Candidatus Omnitrophota bacterium]
MIILALILFGVILFVLGLLFLKINSFKSVLDLHLRDTAQNLSNSNKTIADRLDSTCLIINNVQKNLGEVLATNQQIADIGKSINNFEQLLRAPKFRGQIGEILLANLLGQVLPQDYFILQYPFKNGDTVDAVIRLGRNILPIDAKFPLENFKRLVEADTEDLKKDFRKRFLQDVKLRVEEIASKYILPDEATFDFAFMYIPAENVYYETIIKEDLLSFALSKKVVPVSPNSFYAYLQIICLGLKGLKVEENSQKILEYVTRLEGDLDKFKEDFTVVGVHLNNCLKKYQETDKKLARFDDKLSESLNINQVESNKIESNVY